MTVRLAPGSAPRNGLTWKPYVYNGTGEDTLTAWMDSLPVKLPRGRPADRPCGTPAAYRRHRRHQEPIDDACRAANSIDVSKRKQKRRGAAA